MQVHLNRPVIITHPLFTQLPQELLAHACCLCDSVLGAPGDVMLQKGQNCNFMYFLVRGKLQIVREEVDADQDDGEWLADEGDDSNRGMSRFMPFMKSRVSLGASIPETQTAPDESLSDGTTIRHLGGLMLNAPGYIAAASIFAEQVLPYSVNAISNTELLKLTREDVMSLGDEFPGFRKHMEEFIANAPRSADGVIDFADCSSDDVTAAVDAWASEIRLPAFAAAGSQSTGLGSAWMPNNT